MFKKNKKIVNNYGSMSEVMARAIEGMTKQEELENKQREIAQTSVYMVSFSKNDGKVYSSITNVEYNVLASNVIGAIRQAEVRLQTDWVKKETHLDPKFAVVTNVCRITDLS